jgi:hypothetical protein
MMGFGDVEKQPEQAIGQFRQFLNDSTAHKLIDTTAQTYKNFEDVQEELTQAFKHYKYYYPNHRIPEVVTFISYFGWSTITYDSTILGIGLDMYLGEDFMYPPDVPQFISRTFKKEYIVPNCMKVMSTMLYQFDSGEDNRLISTMVQQGKQLYFLDLMMPDADDYLKMDYSKEDIKWCQKNEPEVWKFFLEKDLIYSSNVTENSKYVTPGPSTAGMPTEAPGNIGSWVGWQIVRKYMALHPETKFDELMHLDAQQILVMSKYKPRHGLF